MRTFAQKTKATQPIMPAKAAKPGWAPVGRSRAVSSILHLQRTAPPAADPPELEADRAAEAVTDLSDPSGIPLIGAAAPGIPQAKGDGAAGGDDEGETCRQKPALAQGSAAGAAPPAVHASAAPIVQRAPAEPLETRLAAFQRLVKEAGKLKLAGNSRALEEWRKFLQQQLTPEQLQAQVHAEEVRSLLARAGQAGLAETALAEQWLQTPGPNRRWVIEQQIGGHLQACSGCHAAVQAESMDRALLEQRGRLLTPLEQLPGGPFEGPQPPFAEAEPIAPTGQPEVFPRVAEAQQRVNAIQPYLRMLGPERYRVLPPETLGSTASPGALLADISSRITQRQADYLEFSRRIGEPHFDYLQLRPIVGELLPVADADVRQAVQDAIAAAEAWETVESIAVGAATIGLLLLAIFPPTSAIGVGGALALAGAVSAHQVYSGFESYEQGRLYALGRGAHDVLDPSQQEAADSLMAVGALNMVMGSIGVASTAVGTVRLIRSASPPGGGLAPLEAVEGRVEGNVYRVTGWGTRDPHVVVTGANGKVIREGPISSFRPSASARTPTTGSTGGGYVYPTEGGAARVAQPVEAIPEPVPVAVPQPVPAPAGPPARIPPDVSGPLAVAGVTSGVETVAAMGGGAQKQPVMPPGLSRDKKELWKTCNQLHTRYKATQGEFAALKSQLDPLRIAAQAKRATPQEILELCALLTERLQIAERLKQERRRYVELDCDQFDWFETGTTPEERREKHEDEWGNVKASIANIHELLHEFCG
jgi:hypothetical protein